MATQRAERVHLDENTVRTSAFAPKPPPDMSGVNWLGFWVLCSKEIQRFAKIFQQTVAGPMMTTLLFLAVFALALGGAMRDVAGIPYLQFLAPGLIVMGVMQNAFANSSSSLLMGKVTGNIVDVLMPPLSHLELMFAYAIGGVARGICVGLFVALAVLFFVPLRIADPVALIYFSLSGAYLMGVLGILTGIWAEKFDHTSAITNFVVTPLSFLSGTFYSIERLPEPFYTASQFNPFFYVIDGFRYSMIGHADASLLAGVLVLAGINIALTLVGLWMFRTGYRIKN